MLTPVKKRSVVDDATEQVARMIVSGEFAPGSRLAAEQVLADQLSITRTSVRSALKRLSDLGLLDIRVGEGVFVQDYREDATFDFMTFALSTGIGVDEKFIRDMSVLLEYLSVKTLELAAENATEEDVRGIQDTLDAYPGTEADTFISGDWFNEFEAKLTRAAHNQIIKYFHNNITALYPQILAISEGTGAVPPPLGKVVYIVEDLAGRGIGLVLGEQLLSDAAKLAPGSRTRKPARSRGGA